MASFEKTSLTKARSRCGTAIPGPGLEVFVMSLWRLFVSVPSVGLFVLLVVTFSIWSNEARVVPYEVGVGLTVILTALATSSWFVLLGRAKQAAGRALGLSARESRKLKVGSPEALNASVRRIRGQRS